MGAKTLTIVNYNIYAREVVTNEKRRQRTGAGDGVDRTEKKGPLKRKHCKRKIRRGKTANEQLWKR